MEVLVCRGQMVVINPLMKPCHDKFSTKENHLQKKHSGLMDIAFIHARTPTQRVWESWKSMLPLAKPTQKVSNTGGPLIISIL